MKTSAKIRVGLVGAGRWGRTLAGAICRHERLELTHVVSRRGQDLGSSSCQVLSCWEPLVDQRLVDALVVATGPASHVSIAERAVGIGLPVIVEKPLTMYPDQAWVLRELASRRNALVLVNHIHLFHPAYEVLKRELAGEAIELVEGTGHNFGPFRREYGALWDYGPHDMALCLDLLGLSGVLERARHDGQGPHSAPGAGLFTLEYSFPQGARAHLLFGNTASSKARCLRITGKRLLWILDDTARDKLRAMDRRSGDVLRLRYPRTEPLLSMFDAFVAALDGRPDPRLGLDLSCAITERLAAVSQRLGLVAD